MKIFTPSDLIDLSFDDLNGCAGKNTAYEILEFINQNKTDFMYNPNCNYKYPIKKINNLCGNTKIELFLNVCDRQKYFDNNIYNIYDLIVCPFVPNNFNDKELQEFNYFKSFFTKLAYGQLIISISSSLSLTYINIPFSLSNKYKIFELVKIKELISICVNNFNDFSLKEQLNIKLYLNWLNTIDIQDINEHIFNSLNLSDKEKEIMIFRNIMTLEETGNKFGLTRERIRQLESKICDKISQKLCEFPFKKIIDNEIYYYERCTDSEKLLLYIDSVLDQFYTKIKKDNKFIFIKTSVINEISDMLKENNTFMKKNGYIEYSYSWNNEVLDIALDYLQLKRHRNNIFNNINKSQMVKFALTKINRPVKIYNEDDRRLIIDTIYHLFGELLDDSRGLEALIEKNCVRVDSGMYALEDNIVPLTKDTFNKIVEYVKDNIIINARDLFVPFGETLIEHNLLNENILYRYLKENLSDILYFNGVSGVISSNSDDSSWGTVIIKCIKEKGKPISKAEIIGRYPVTTAVYDNLPINFNDIIKWGKGELFLKSLIYFPEEVKTKFLQLLSKQKIMKFDEIRALLNYLDKSIISSNQIIDNYSLISFLNNTVKDKVVLNRKNEIAMIKEDFGEVKVGSYSIAEELTI
ncbi:MAG: hypothetical protein IJN13_03325 [Bacilli bacterium]|nr:hypothetical protein [Bacilli bacterium]